MHDCQRQLQKITQRERVGPGPDHGKSTGSSKCAHAHFEEAPEALLHGVVREATKWVKPRKLEKNIRKLADVLGVPKDADRWLDTK